MTQHHTSEDMNPQTQCSVRLKFESQSQAMKINRALKYMHISLHYKCDNKCIARLTRNEQKNMKETK
jgi:hypothetical protein